VVIPVLTWMHARHGGAGSGRGVAAGVWRQSVGRYVPAFVVGFLLMAVLRSIGDAILGPPGFAFGAIDGREWKQVIDVVGDTVASRVLLGTAMAAVGLSTSFEVFRGVGLKPFAVGLAGAIAVGSAGMLMAVLFGRFVTL
jgi:uncharacterized membrane protein YadS